MRIKNELIRRFKLKQLFVGLLVFSSVILLEYYFNLLNAIYSGKAHQIIYNYFIYYENNTTAHHEKWIVISIDKNPDVNNLKELTNIDEFKLLLIGNIEDVNSEAVIIKSDDNNVKQFKSYKAFTKSNVYTIKNLAYLYAIKNGAKYIYDLEDDVILDDTSLDDIFTFNDNHDYGLVIDCNSPLMLNPYVHFGQPRYKPRGFYKQSTNYSGYICGKRKTSIIQHSLIKGYADTDQQYEYDLKYDDVSPSFQVPINRFSIYNSKNTLFSYRSFWSLYLPDLTPDFVRYTDIVRSLWSQRLMWLIDETVTFTRSNAFRQFKNIQNDNDPYGNLDVDLSDLIDILLKWKCNQNGFYECMLDLTSVLINEDYFHTSEQESVRKWIEDLTSFGYVQPTIVNRKDFNIHVSNKTGSMKCDLKSANYFLAKYTPIIQKQREITNRTNIFEYFSKFCQENDIFLNATYDFLYKQPYRSNYSLLITFNFNPRIDNIIMLKNIYGDYFRNIVVCAKNITVELKDVFGYEDSFTFIELDLVSGYFHYYCMTKAIELNLNTEGYLLMSDDVLLKYWNVKRTMDYNKIWFFMKPIGKNELIPKSKMNWVWWDTDMGRDALIKMLEKFDSYLKGNTVIDDYKVEIVKKYVNLLNLHQNSKGNYTKVLYAGSDIFYLPKYKFKDFHVISELFRENRIFLELAVPTILIGLYDNDDQFQLFKGHYIWGSVYDYSEYSSDNLFYHPAKISQYKNSTLGTRFCNLFIRDKLRFDSIL